jgi:hypothetical protein
MATPVDKPDSTIGTSAPIVVDFGKHRRKRVKQLRKGRGPLMAEVARCVQELQTAGTIGATAQPVVLIVRQKPRKRLGWPLA